MRLAPFARPVIVGLSVVVTSFAVLPASFAWQLFGSPSARNRSTAAAPAAAIQGSNTASSSSRGPLFHGKELRLPSLPFMRSKPETVGRENSSHATAARPTSQATRQVSSRFGAQATAPSARSPQSMSQVPSPGGGRPYRNNPTAQVVVPSHDPAQARPQHVLASREASSSVDGVDRATQRPQEPSIDRSQRAAIQSSPQPVAIAPRDASREPTLAAAESIAATSAAETTTAESPADQLIAQAHEWSGSAESQADYTRIIDACRQARSEKPSPAAHRYAAELASWAYNRRGQLHAEAGRHQAAIADFDDSLRADSERWLASHNRGVLLAQSGELELAFDDFTRTIELNPKFAKAYSNRAALLMLAGDLDSALTDYRRAVEFEPELAVAQRGCGRVYHLQRRLDKALRHYDEAVRLTPDDAYTVASRADLLTDLGHYAEAVAEYERSIQLDPDSDHAYSSSAWLLATSPDASVRNPDLAIERARRAIELTNEQDAVCFDTLAAAQASAGDFSAAMQTMRHAVAMASPEVSPVYRERLLMYQHAKPYRIAPVGEVMQANYESR